MSKQKTLENQLKSIIYSQQRIGESRHLAKQENRANGGDGRKSDYVHGIGSLKVYLQQAHNFADFVKSQNPNCRTVEDARQFADDYIRSFTKRASQDTAAAALGRLYNEASGNFRRTITDRTPTKGRSGSTGTNWAKHEELYQFQRAIGMRHADFFRPENLWLNKEITTVYHTRANGKKLDRQVILNRLTEENGKTYFYHISKGGRVRRAEVIENRVLSVRDIIAKAKTTGKEKIFNDSEVPKNANIHALRREYALELYKQEVDAGCCGKFGVYECRGDRAGERYDKQALGVVAEALGHSNSRYFTVVNNYLR